MKAFWGILILVVGASLENSSSTTTSVTSVGGTIGTVDLSTTNASTNDTTRSTLDTATANITEEKFSVTSPNINTTDSNTTENAGNISTRMMTTDNTKRSPEWTSNNGSVVPNSSTTQQCNQSKVDTPFIVAGVAIFLAVIWSFCLCCWYRRKLSRVKTQFDAERALSMHEVNGRKISDVKFSVGKVDKEHSSVSKNIHGEDEDPEDSSSDLYDVTDPNYEDADGTKSSKAKERSDDEEDSDYDLLNEDDKRKNHESEYASAEFKTSVEDFDNDTYDTTETCNRIICNKKHENCGGKHLAENPSNLNSSDSTELQNQTKEMKADSQLYDQVRAEENREEKNKNGEDQATIKDMLTVGNKTTVENKTAVDDNTAGDKKTVRDITKVENKATVENQTTGEDEKTIENNTPVEGHESVESKATVEDKSTAKNEAMIENNTLVEDHASVESKARVEDKSSGENKAMIEDQVKIEDGATVGDNNGKMNKPCEKTTTSKIDNDTNCVTFEYELVKIDQKPNDTQENMQGTPTSV